MKTENNLLSKKQLSRLRAQGYAAQTNEELSELAFGIRFAYRLCLSVLIVAIVTKSMYLFSIMMGIAALGVVLPNHPFDYLYNHALRYWLEKPELPARSAQLKFACSIATVWLTTVIYLLWKDYTITALIMAGVLAFVAALPSTTDLCIPSIVYNILFKKKQLTSNQI